MEQKQMQAWREIVFLSLTVHGRQALADRMDDPDIDPYLLHSYKMLVTTAPVSYKAAWN
jgi:hypothetical protein